MMLMPIHLREVDVDGQDTKSEQTPENKGTLMLDATCAPSDIRYPQDFPC